MTTYYCKPDAVGTEDGLSWANALTELSDDAFTNAGITLADGDIIYLDADVNNKMYCNIRIDEEVTIDGCPTGLEGTNGVSYLVGHRSDYTWTQEGTSNVYSTDLTVEPHRVSYNLQPDDLDGTVTGINVNSTRNARCRRVSVFADNLADDRLTPWYGHLRQAASAPSPVTTLAEGEWYYDAVADKLYVNAGASPTTSNFQVAIGDFHGIVSFGGPLTIRNLFGLNFANDGENNGYFIVFRGGSNHYVENIHAESCGYHNIGCNNAAGRNITYKNCSIGSLSGGGGLFNPIVFYTNNNPGYPDGPYNLENIYCITTPLLDLEGKPIQSGLDLRPIYSHTDADGSVIGGFHIKNFLWIDESPNMMTKHSISDFYSAREFMRNSQAPPGYDFFDKSTHYATFDKLIFSGDLLPLPHSFPFIRCWFDYGGYDRPSEALVRFDLGEGPIEMDLCVIILGDWGDSSSDQAIFRQPLGDNTNNYLKLNHCTLVSENDSALAGLSPQGIVQSNAPGRPEDFVLTRSVIKSNNGNSTTVVTVDYNMSWTSDYVDHFTLGWNLYDTGTLIIKRRNVLTSGYTVTGAGSYFPITGWVNGTTEAEANLDSAFVDGTDYNLRPSSGGALESADKADLDPNLLNEYDIFGRKYDGTRGALQLGDFLGADDSTISPSLTENRTFPDGFDWTTPANAAAEDASYASVAITNQLDTSDILLGTFDLPPDFNNLYLRIKGYATNSAQILATVYLYDGSTLIDAQSIGRTGLTSPYLSFTQSNDWLNEIHLGDFDLTPSQIADLSDPKIGILLQGSGSANTYYVDTMEISLGLASSGGGGGSNYWNWSLTGGV